MAIFTNEMGDKILISTMSTQRIKEYIVVLNNKIKEGVLEFTQTRHYRLHKNRGIIVVQDYDKAFIVNNCSWTRSNILKTIAALNKELIKRKKKEVKNVSTKKVRGKSKTHSTPSKLHGKGGK